MIKCEWKEARFIAEIGKLFVIVDIWILVNVDSREVTKLLNKSLLATDKLN